MVTKKKEDFFSIPSDVQKRSTKRNLANKNEMQPKNDG